MTAPLLCLDRLGVRFDLDGGGELDAVREVSLTLAPGERLGLVGESGCGKTTVMLATMGLLPPSASVSGGVLVDGVNILAGRETSARAYRWRDIAIVFQSAMNAFNPVRRVGDQIVEPMRLHGIAAGKQAWRMAGEQILELLVRLSEDRGLALLLVTHDLSLVSRICHRAAVMYAGQVVETGPVRDLYHDPRHPYTRLLFSATPDVGGSGESVS